MKILYDWLKEFVNFDLLPAELRSRLSLAGIAIEALEQTPAGPLLDADLTINRPDCLSHYGMAREVAALVRGHLRPLDSFPWFEPTEATLSISGKAQVAIESPDLCGRYTARLIRGVKVGPSPEWLRRRLEALGQASINNLVDATNYVMLELGQPLHAFDFDKLAGGQILVRRAHRGEKIRTLDGIERALTPDMCVIADTGQAVAVAGVMGGAGSEISLASRNVLIESAWFDPISVRRASKALGFRTEASMRFERGADPEICEIASRRCANLIREIAGGEILPGVIDAYPGRRPRLEIQLSRSELLRIMGADISDQEIESIFSALGFLPKRIDEKPAPNSPGAIWRCEQPSWRQDVSREIDLIEEVVRHHGLEKFPPHLGETKRPSARLPHAKAEDLLRERLIGLGYREIISIPLVNEEEDAAFRLPGVSPVRVTNPLAADASILRSNGYISVVHALSWNLNRGQHNLRLFEIGRVYEWHNAELRELRVLTIGATGMARQKEPFESERKYEFADLKGDLDQIGQLAGGLSWSPIEQPSWQNGAQAGQIALRGPIPQAPSALESPIGLAAKLASRVADRFKLRQDVFLGGLGLDAFYTGVSATRTDRHYQPFSRFPAVDRDFSLVLADGTSFAGVRDAIAALGIPEISSIEAVDLFRGKSLPAGKFSLLVRVMYQSREGSLTEAQVNEFSARILAALQEKLGAALRTS